MIFLLKKKRVERVVVLRVVCSGVVVTFACCNFRAERGAYEAELTANFVWHSTA
jgi:hypothetical protein